MITVKNIKQFHEPPAKLEVDSVAVLARSIMDLSGKTEKIMMAGIESMNKIAQKFEPL